MICCLDVAPPFGHKLVTIGTQGLLYAKSRVYCPYQLVFALPGFLAQNVL
jgi:hypothetical protein